MGVIRQGAVVCLLAATAAVLVGCTGAPAPAEPPHAASSSEAGPSPSASPEPDPALVPDGTAGDNLPYFDFVNSALLDGGNPGGRAVIDNLIAAGFDRGAMEVTADRTPLGSEVDSLQFSVRIGDGCLIGQADGDGYTSVVADALESGSCLVGKTRAIDW